jgi:hypothetical protein
MNPKKQRAMEERYKVRGEWPKTKRKVTDPRETTDIASLQSELGYRRKLGFSDEESLAYLAHYYKGLRELYDQVIAMENSPLMKALS